MKVFPVLLMLGVIAASGGALHAQAPQAVESAREEGEEEEEQSAPPARPATAPREMRERLQRPKHLPEALHHTAGSRTSGESVPLPEDIRSRVLADAAQRAGVKSEGVTVSESVAVTWPDGSLGCPERGVRYTQLPIPGYRVTVAARGTTYDYRVGTPAASGPKSPAASDRAVEIRLCDPSQGLDPLGPR